MEYRGYYIEELIHVWNIYADYDAWRDLKPVLHSASSLDEAKQWVDRYVESAGIKMNYTAYFEDGSSASMFGTFQEVADAYPNAIKIDEA